MARDAQEWEGRVRFVGVVPGPDEDVDEQAVRDAAERHGLAFAHVRDRDLSLTRRFGIEGTPTVVVVGAGGRVLYQDKAPPGDWTAVLAR